MEEMESEIDTFVTLVYIVDSRTYSILYVSSLSFYSAADTIGNCNPTCTSYSGIWFFNRQQTNLHFLT
jgi:hypothetical protein